MIKSMTTGHPLSLMILFSIPVLLGNLFQQFYILSDIYIVGHYLGVTALSVIGVGAPIFLMCLYLANGFTQGLAIITAQRFGAQDIQGVKRSFAIGNSLSLIISCLITLTLIGGMDIVLRLTNTPADIYTAVRSFLFVMTCSLSATIFYNFFAAVLRALGDSKTPLLFLVFASVLNIIFNVSFIVVFNCGVIACAYGTGLAQFISVILCLIYMLKRFEILRLKKSDWVIEASFLKEHLKIACVMSLQFSIIGLGMIIMQTVCNTFGPKTIAAFMSATRLEQFMSMPLFALGVGVTNYMAQNYGASLVARIRQGALQAFSLAVAIAVFLDVFVYVSAPYLIGFFLDTSDKEVYQQALLVLRIVPMFWVFLGMIFVFRQTVQGMGNTIFPFTACVIELFMRWFAAVYLTKEFGYIGLCFATPIAWIAGGLWGLLGYFYLMQKKYHIWFKKEVR